MTMYKSHHDSKTGVQLFQVFTILISIGSHILWQKEANKGNIDTGTRDAFRAATASLGVLIAFFVGIQFQEAAGKRSRALAITVQLDGAKYLLVQKGIWKPNAHPFDYIENVDRGKKLGSGFGNFDPFSWFLGIASILGELHALSRVHSETRTFNAIFRAIILIAYTIAIPIASTVTHVGLGAWQLYMTIAINVLTLIVYFAIDIAQTHSIHKLANFSEKVGDYWRLNDKNWIPEKHLVHAGIMSPFSRLPHKMA